MLALATAVNIAIGLTPYVDNFMHVGGMIGGLLMGLVLFSQRAEDATGRHRPDHAHGPLPMAAAHGALFICVTSSTQLMPPMMFLAPEPPPYQ